jgi:hypothetical protein
MLYLTGCIPAKPELQQQLLDNNIGALLTPFSQRSTPSADWPWAADNGCFAERWNEKTWQTWLETKEQPQSALFATVPDVVGDHAGTRKRWDEYAPTVIKAGYKPAFVLQDGVIVNEIPFDTMGALFIGGTTEFKLSNTAREIVAMCKEKKIWVHMGRVNSLRRMELAMAWGCDSVDGTFLAFGPDINTPKLIKMVVCVHQPKLFDGVYIT